MINTVRSGRGMHAPFKAGNIKFADEALSAEQRAAVKHLNGTSRHRRPCRPPPRLIPRQRLTVTKSDGWTCPKSGRAETREHGSRGQGRRSRWFAHEKRVCGDRIGAKRIGGRCSFAMRHFAHGACAVIGGVAGNSPLEWGAGDDGQRRGSRAGKVLSP